MPTKRGDDMPIYSEKCPHCGKDWPVPDREVAVRLDAQKEKVLAWKLRRAAKAAKELRRLRNQDRWAGKSYGSL